MGLRAIRLKKRLTQAQLGLLAGVSQPVISSMEAEHANPTWDSVCRVSYALGEWPETIFGIPTEFRKKAKWLQKYNNKLPGLRQNGKRRR
jgi:transcriptional regulator with XRE-family HTH domain